MLGLGTVALKGVLTIGLLFVVGRFLLPRMFAQAARTKSPELFLAASLLVVIVASLATAAAGLSPIVGALIAGLLIAWYFFVPTVFSFAISERQALLTLAIYAVTSAVLGLALGLARRALDAAALSEARLARAAQESVHRIKNLIAVVQAIANKIGLAAEQYFIVQNIYRGWSLFGFVLIGALVANLLLALLLRGGGKPGALALVACACISLTLVVFFTWTYPANQATSNWTTIPADWEYLRRQWEYSHAANALVTFVAFCAVVLSVLTTRN